MSKKPVYPDDLDAILDAKIAEILERESRLSQERTRVHLYFNQELPPVPTNGSCTYVDSTVRDTVVSMRALLMKAFGGGHDIAGFSQTKFGDSPEAARIATEYTRYLIFKENPGYQIFKSLIDDGLKARVGIMRVWWDERYEYEDHEFNGVDPMAAAGMQIQDEITHLEIEDDHDDFGLPMGTISGKLTRKIDCSTVAIESVPPEEFFIEPQARQIERSFHGVRMLVTKAEIKDMGLPVELMEHVAPDADDFMSVDYETHARNSRLDPLLTTNGSITRDEDKKFWLYECFLPQTSEDGRPALFRIMRVGDVILDYAEVDRSPFIQFVPLPIAHSFEGENFAALSIQTQNARTMIRRAELDHAAHSTHPRWQVLNGTVKARDELLDNRAGGIINVTQMGGIEALPQQTLNPALPGIEAQMKADNEQRTGISALSLGINEGVLENQNSYAMVDQQIGLAQVFLEDIARQFSEITLKQLFTEVYRLVIENDKRRREQSFEIAGNYVDIDPKTWIARKDADVYLHLSQDSAGKEAADFLSMMAMFKQDPVLQHCITPQNTFAAAVKVARLKGYADFAAFMTPPDQVPPPPPPQPDPVVMAQLQLASKEVDIKMMEAQMKAKKLDQDFELEKARLQIQIETLELKKHTAIGEMERKIMVSAANIDTDMREMELLENSPPAANLTAIANPHPST